jgi:hypothetical protein
MSRKFAILTPEKIIGNVIVADSDEFIKNHQDWSQYEYIDITGYDPEPAVLWMLIDGKFVKPEIIRPSNENHILDDKHLEVEVKA